MARPAATTPDQHAEHRYLRVADLRRLRHMFFSSRRVVEGQYAGRHASPQRGHSVEFSDYREYRPGDEIGDIDWKVYGRSDRFFVKLFEHQSDMSVTLLVDGSASMAYQSQTRPGKYDQAAQMAASIAFLTTRQQDKVALGIAREGLAGYLRPMGSYGHLNSILTQLEQVQPAGQANLAEALQQLARHVARKGLIIILSDLLEDDDAVLRALSMFTHRGNEVIVFHILDADELHLPDLAEALFVDSESGQRLRLNVDDVRQAYEQRLSRFTRRWSGACKARGIDYRLVSTAEPYHKALADYLFTRASMT
jgi:uncharacterized protein (DUF58 family)